MKTEAEFKGGIKNNKGKFAVLVLYLLAVFGSPLFLLTPVGQDSVEALTKPIFAELDREEFREFIGLLRSGESEQAYSQLAPETQENASLEDLQNISTTLAYTAGNPRVVGGGFNHTNIASLNVTEGEPDSSKTSTYEVSYLDENVGTTTAYTIINLVAEEKGEGLMISGVHLSTSGISLEELTSFDWSTHGVYLILSILIPLIIAFTAFQYIRKNKKPNWVMFLIILLLSVYFTSKGDGGWSINIGAYGGFTPGNSLSPWIFAIPLPLGVIIYYARRFMPKKLIR